MSNTPVITVQDKPDADHREAILAQLIAHNRKAHGSANRLPVAITVADPQTGAIVGGIWGEAIFDWLFIELLAIPEHMRGFDLGTQLMRKAEEVARAHGCVGVWLDTHTFQAPDFYPKLGYELFATLDDHPRGKQRFFYKKRID